ncbi:methyltransferase family protein [Actinocorallia herbida]|uniref:Methyltransferase family protein n=1 Tax=Actinocorallia herbida TaxID=58109 RepID=A0A3N1CNS9_9ACTN|nr:class I SAM-dependent methyltransferase [Actinocorallia herbida]ROO82952.1 methyltransferase family protein [Actinocorallia herbida]
MTVSSPSAPVSFVQGPTASHFSSYLVSVALSATHELGILDALHVEGVYTLGESGEGLDPTVVARYMNALMWGGIVEIDGAIVRPGPLFDDAFAARGYFYWMVRGCGTLFTEAPGVTSEASRGGDFYSRDMRAVAIGSKLIGDGDVEPLFDRLLEAKGASVVADLGCGSGQRLMRVAGIRPGTRGIGLDISSASVELASQSVASAGLADVISVHRADVLDLGEIPGAEDVDVITCSFMGHDFWPHDTCVNTLRGLRETFPNAHTFLLCDVVRSTGLPGDGTPIFTLGFELVHALMGVYLPTLEEWRAAFAESGWRCAVEHAVPNPPGGYLFQLEAV